MAKSEPSAALGDLGVQSHPTSSLDPPHFAASRPGLRGGPALRKWAGGTRKVRASAEGGWEGSGFDGPTQKFLWSLTALEKSVTNRWHVTASVNKD